MVLIQKTLSQSIDSIALSYTCKYMILNNLHHSSQSIHSIVTSCNPLRSKHLQFVLRELLSDNGGVASVHYPLATVHWQLSTGNRQPTTDNPPTCHPDRGVHSERRDLRFRTRKDLLTAD